MRFKGFSAKLVNHRIKGKIAEPKKIDSGPNLDRTPNKGKGPGLLTRPLGPADGEAAGRLEGSWALLARLGLGVAAAGEAHAGGKEATMLARSTGALLRTMQDGGGGLTRLQRSSRGGGRRIPSGMDGSARWGPDPTGIERIGAPVSSCPWQPRRERER